MAEDPTPKTPRSIVRNHSPYCESTGPIVQEGFVASRVQALQGFSNQAQNVARSHSPLAPCPRLYSEIKPALVGADVPDTGTIKRFHTHIFLKAHRNLVRAPLTRISDIAPSLELQDRQSSPEPTMPTSPQIRGIGAKISGTKLFEDGVPASQAQKYEDRVTVPGTPYDPLSEVGRINNMTVRNSTSSEKSILRPHAIQADPVELRTALNSLPQTEDHVHEQTLKLRGSIADKLGSMVEQGWTGEDTSSIVHSDHQFAPYTTTSKSQIRGTRLDSSSDSLDEMLRLGGFSTAETRTESHHSTRQATPSYIWRKVPRTFVYGGSQKQREIQAKRSPAISTSQRSSSDFGGHYLKNESATPEGKRRARTSHGRGDSESGRSQIQPGASFNSVYNCAWDHHNNGQDHKPTKLPLLRESSIPKSGSDLTMLRDERLDQRSAALPKNATSRCSSSNTKESIRSASRSTSFFRKFPWYKVALVDKDSAVHSLSRGDCGNDRTLRATPATQLESTPNQVEVLRGTNKPRTLVGRGHEEDQVYPEVKTSSYQSPADQPAINTTMFKNKVSSQSSHQLMTSPEEITERQVPEHIQRAPVHPQDCHTASLGTWEEHLLSYPHQVFIHGAGHAQGLTRTGSSSTQPGVSSQSRPKDANVKSHRSGDIIQSFQHRGLELTEQSGTQSYTSSNAETTMLHADNGLNKGSSGLKTVRPRQGFTANSSLSSQPRSEVQSLTPKHLGTGKASLPASVPRSDQNVPIHQEARGGGGKGIKKIQVTVTFDGAEDLVVEATSRDRHEHWRTEL